MLPRRKLFPPPYGTVFSATLAVWSASVLAVGLAVNALELPYEPGGVLQALAVTTAVERWTAATEHRAVAQYVWVWSTWTVPAAIAWLVWRIREIDIVNWTITVVMTVLIAYFAMPAFLSGTLFGISIAASTGTSPELEFYRTDPLGPVAGAIIVGINVIFVVSVTMLIGLRRVRRPPEDPDRTGSRPPDADG